MENPLKKVTSEQSEEKRRSKDISEEIEEIKSQDPYLQGEEGSKSPFEQAEDSISEDLHKQSRGWTETLLETSEQPTQEEREWSHTQPSSFWEKSTAKLKDELSTLLATEPDLSTHFDTLSLDSNVQDLEETDWTEPQPETPRVQFGYEEVPYSLWKKTKRKGRDEIPSCPMTERKLGFHDSCCSSAFDRMIQHSPVSLPKSPHSRRFSQKHPAQKFKRSEVCFSFEQLPKQRLPVSATKKKECKGFAKTQPPRMASTHFHISNGRKSKALYSLYTTFCDEDEFDPHLSEGAKGISRACTIFSAIKEGRINVNHLLLTLHTLGILLAAPEMQKALRCIPVDAHGNLDFADFLDIVNNVLPYTESEALQNAQQVFRKINKDMVNIEDLHPVLSSLGVTMSSKIVQQALGCTQVTWDGKLNISEFLSAVAGPLGYQKEVDEYISSERGPFLDIANLCDLNSLWQKKMLEKELPPDRDDLITFYDPDEVIDLAELQRETPVPKKSVGLKQPRITYPVHPIEEKDKGQQNIVWPKIQPSFCYSSQNTLFPLISSLPLKKAGNVQKQKTKGFSLTHGPNGSPAPISVVQSANHEAIKKQKKKKSLSFQMNLPRRYDSEDNKSQEPNSRKPGSEEKGQSDQKALQDAFDVIHMLAGDSVKDHELWSILKKLGVNLNNMEFQDLLKKTNVEKGGIVNFNSFMVALGKTQIFTELAMLKNAIQAIEKIEGDKMIVHDLPFFVRNMGIRMSDQEFEQALKQVPIDGSGKVIVKDFIKVLIDIPHFSELSVLKDAIKAVSNIEGNKVSLNDLKPTLRNMGIRLYPQEYEELIQTTPTDKEGNVDIEQVKKKIAKIERFSEMEVLNNTIKAFGQFEDGKVKVSDIDECLSNIGVHLTPTELAQAKKSLNVSADGTLNVIEMISIMKGTNKFKTYSAVLEAILALKFIKEYKNMESKRMRRRLNTFGLQMANEVISQVLTSAHMTEAGQAKFNDFLRTLIRSRQFKTSSALADGFKTLAKLKNGRIGVEDLQIIMKSFNMILSSKDLSEALAFCSVDDDKTVDLKDFLRGVTYTGTFITNPELQLTCIALSKLQGDQLDLYALESTLSSMDLPEANELLQEVMKTAQVDGHGKMNFREFMRIVVVVPELPKAIVLKDTFNAMSDIKDHQIHTDELPKTLIAMGINLMPEELEQLKDSITVSGDGTVGFKDVMMAMTGVQSFAEFHALQNAFDVMNKTCKEKIKKEDLPLILESLGIQLSPEELQATLSLVSIDESGKLDGTEVLTILSSAPRFSKLRALQNATKAVENIKTEKMTVKELEKTLQSMGVHLPNKVFNEVIKAAKTDASGKIDFKEFLLALGETEDFAELEVLQRGIKTIGATCDSQLHTDKLLTALDNLGIHLSDEEFQEVLNTIDVDDDGTINLKDFLMTLSKMPRFTDAVELHSNIHAFTKLKGEKVDVEELESMLHCLGIYLNTMEFQKALECTSIDENGKVTFKEFLVNVMDNERFSEFSAVHDVYNLVNVIDNDKFEVSQLNDVLTAIGITLSKEEMKEVQKKIPVDHDGKVTLKDFMKILPRTRRFSTAVEMEEAMQTMNSIKEDKANIEELESITRRMDLHLSPDEIQQALKYVSKNDDDTVSVKDFMFGLTNTQRFSKPESGQSDTVAVDDVSSLLSNMGIYLTKEQLQDTLKRVKVDENGKVNMTELIESVKKTQSEAGMERVHVHDLDAVLAKMSIHLTNSEIQEALKYAYVDEDGRVNLNDFMNAVRRTVRLILGAEGKAIEIGDSALTKMGIQVTEEEMQEALKHVIIDIDGRVNLKDVLESILLMERPSKHERDKVSIKDLDNVMANIGIHLTEEELKEVLKNTTVDAEGKVNLGEVIKWVRTVQLRPPSSNGKMSSDDSKEKITVEKLPTIMVDGWTKEKRVDIDSLDAILDELGIHLTNKQLYEALKYSPMDVDGKVELEPFMRGVKDILRNQKTGKTVEISTLESVLADMGLFLTQDEVQQALGQTTVNKDGNVDLKDFMWAIQSIPSMQDKQVQVDNLDAVLGGMGIYLNQEELQDALKLTKHYENEMVNLKDFIRACNATLTLSGIDGYPRKMPGAKSLKLPKVVEKHNRPLIPGRMISSVTLSEVASLKGVKDLTKPELEAFRDAYDTFSKDIDGNIDLLALEDTAHKLGINLTAEEVFDELVYADTDGDGKVNFTDFLNTITDSKHFIQAVAPKNGNIESVDTRGILLFEILSRLVEMSMLSRKTTVNIVSYYRKKFMEATGKKAWRADSIDEDIQKRRYLKKRPMHKTRSSPLSAFAGAARICVMNDQELRDYTERLRATIKMSESPYAQVPIFPLIPNRDNLLKGRPKKDLQKLEAQRRMEPVASFEDHFFHKKKWLKQEAKLSKDNKPALTLAPKLKQRREHFTMDNLAEIRREVQKATTAYRRAIALQERKKSLKLWRRLRGGEIGLESGNSAFYQIFSTYSWSWNVCQELLTPRELQEYDNKLYHRRSSRSSTSADKRSSLSRRQNGSQK
ncbi:EF-hand calcium-binding domain-containing protein 13 isoform X2 [Anolis carolinensis]|uniref:EF-hand calcium-binding domain-containing protein 13 isoform X2 n=1 Tax=Anolis carolinensis TaxID=28377 RepID=UPI002F2B4152